MSATPHDDLTAFVAEDEPPARERLVAALARVAPRLRVVGHADSVKGTQEWLAAHAAPDLLLLDIQLADGLSLELFADGRLALPTIFTTAYDRFALDAFRALAVDYLLKPVSDEALARALAKLAALRRSFGADVAAFLRRMSEAAPAGTVAAGRPAWRDRLLGRRGAGFHALPVAHIAYVVSIGKVSHAVDAQGERYVLDQPLAELEAELDPSLFFRASRQLLVSASAVARFTVGARGRLKVDLRPPLPGDAWVSQERAAAFRAWMGG